MEQPPKGLAVRCDARGRILEVVCDTIGLANPPVVGDELSVVFPKDNRDKVDELFRELSHAGAVFGWSVNAETTQGVSTLLLAGAQSGPDFVITAAEMADADRMCAEFVAMNSDLVNSVRELSQHKAQADVSLGDLENNRHFLETILETTPNIVYIFDLEDARFVYLNSVLTQVLGVDTAEAMLHDPRDRVLGGERLSRLGTEWAEIMHAEDNQIMEREYRVLDAAGDERLLASREKVFARGPDGLPQRILGIATDITDRKRTEDSLRESEESYRRQFAENSAVMLMIDPADGHIIEANRAAERFYGHPAGTLTSMRIDEISESSPSEIKAAMSTVLEDQGRQFTFRHRLADGSVRDVDVSSSRIRFGRPLLHSIIHDVTERTQLAAELEAHARTDSLTRVANRRGFLERATHERARAIRHGRPLALVAMDLDDLKVINDTYGHAAGDAALVAFAQACRDNVRAIDLIARFGGDEFVLLLPETDTEAGREVAERILSALATTVVGPDESPLQVAACAGVASLASGHESLDHLLSRADAALYRAKELGRTRVEIAPPQGFSSPS